MKTTNKSSILPLLLVGAFALMPALLPSAALAQSYPWGTTLVSGGTWMGGHGVNVYWNGTPTCNPSYVGGNSYTTYNGTQYYTGEEYQCGELPFRLYTTEGWYLGAWPDTYAYQMYTAPPAGMTTYANGSGYIPVPGDCVVWNAASDTDSAGHVAVVNYVDGGHVYICEQNMCNYGASILDRSGSNGSFFTREDGWGAGALLGCVHCNNNPATYSNTHINPCVARTSDGRLEVFAIGHSANLLHNYQTSPGGSWSGWISLGTNIIVQNASPAVGVNADGRLEVFVVDGNGAVDHVYQKVAGSSASTNWTSIGLLTSSQVSTTAKLAVGNWANGSMDLFVIGTDGVLYHNYQTAPNGGWFGFVSLGGSWQQDADIAVGSEKDGRLNVFLIGNTGNLYHNWQTAVNGTSWNGFSDLSGALAEQVRLTVGRNSNGRLEAFTLGTDGVAYTTSETSSNSPTSWTSWSGMGGVWEVDAKPVVAADQNGALELFLIGSTGNMYHNYQTSPSGSWSGWVELNGSFTQNVRPCVGMNKSGTLEVFLTGPSADMQHAYETAPNSTTWSGWSSLGGSWN